MSVTLRLPTIPEVITDLKAKKIHIIFTQTTTPEANKMRLYIFCACVTDVFDGVVRKKTTQRRRVRKKEEQVRGENRSR